MVAFLNSTPKYETTPVHLTLVPGPDRKRTPRPYAYRLTYRNPDVHTAGCGMTWEVSGGRMTYQIALEITETGRVRFHCTCADAVYRAEAEGRFCKHVRALCIEPQCPEQV